ncbi:hypothetical protein [Jiella sonneratiae]|uniref:Uncharacterized protein n=1 Tax=Jiella sonneratiae TaxID=2816856 RepID=A0ABS3IYP3_9HYPH|nr:hypothetical protein [Jiella sonneratiae]MBO0902525.1 hypothetical protein [Jiella sonneratiae]
MSLTSYRAAPPRVGNGALGAVGGSYVCDGRMNEKGVFAIAAGFFAAGVNSGENA